MKKCQRLLTKAKNSAANIRFGGLCQLAECYGWIFVRQEGSHRMYENPKLDITLGRMMNFQNDKGKAKPYQVRQLLNAIDNLDE